MEAQLKEIMPVTLGLREDDHPAAASAPDGSVWIAWVSYSETSHDTLIFARQWKAGRWGQAEQVSAAPGDYHKPAVAVTGDGAVSVVWPAQVAKNWDLYARRRTPAGAWSKAERLTEDPAPDMLPAAAAQGNRLLLVWQSPRRKSFDILGRMSENGRWSPEDFITASPANDWEPVVAAGADGAFHVAWDSYRGDYDVLMRSWRGGQWGPERAVAASDRLENHPGISVDAQNRVWVTWEEGPAGWASDSSDGGLRARRDIGLALLDGNRLQRMPAAESALRKLAGEDGMQSPLVHQGRDGILRLFFRQPMNKNWLSVGVTAWDGAGWSKPEMFYYSEGRIDQRIVGAEAGTQWMVVYPAGSAHNTIYARLFDSGSKPAAEQLPALEEAVAQEKAPQPERASHDFRGYRLVWGDLHRHTDISEDGGLLDGSLMDCLRYSFDAAGLDFIGVTDHTRYLPRRYNLWRIQQISDVFYKPGLYIPVHAYERSQYSPWGHRNIVNLNRDYEPVPGSYDIGDPGVSPWGLFQALKGKKAISIPHTSAWGNKQVSWDYYDPEVERLVEIFQGLRSTYEYNGAPDPAGRAVYEKDSKNFVWDALSRGNRLGFIASSDHRSTHMSFAAVYTKTMDRQGVYDALFARRTYAASDKILLDVSMGQALMGEETTVQGTPELAVAVEGTAPIARIDIIRNGKFVYTAEPGNRKASFTFRDQSYQGEPAYYYVRVIQADKNMAWASPIWVNQR